MAVPGAKCCAAFCNAFYERYPQGCVCLPAHPFFMTANGNVVNLAIGNPMCLYVFISLQTFPLFLYVMSNGLLTIILLVISNTFMTLAWYGHLKLQENNQISNWPLIAVILFSWGIALFEYCAQVPANRIGFRENGGPFSLFQLKIIQEVISLTVFTVMACLMFKGEALHWNHLAAFGCLIMAVFFAFLKA